MCFSLYFSKSFSRMTCYTSICVSKSITKKWLYQTLSTLKIGLKPTLTEIFTHKKFDFSHKSAYNITDIIVFLTADRFITRH